MRERRATTINDLREAIDCLPRRTRLAMLQGIEQNPIIAGAYTDSNGICPMLAAHRAGGRTDLIAFARAWDCFVFAGQRLRQRRARPATGRELRILRTHLEASLLADEAPVDLGEALREHRELVDRNAGGRHDDFGAPGQAPPDPLERDVADHGRWRRLVTGRRRYGQALRALEAEHEALQEREALVRELELQLESV
jgi:hypothetical protein